MTFGDRLVHLRYELKRSREEVAKDLEIPYATYSHYENNTRNPNFQTLVLLAEYFGVSSDYLLGISSDSLIHGLKEGFFENVPENHILDKKVRRNWIFSGFSTFERHHSTPSTKTTMHISRYRYPDTLPNLENLTWEQACLTTRGFLLTQQREDSSLYSFLISLDTNKDKVIFEITTRKVMYYNIFDILP